MLQKGALEFFAWVSSEEGFSEICYMPACNELEIKVSIPGRGDLHQKRAISFESFVEYAQDHFNKKSGA